MSAFRDMYSQFTDSGAQVLGVSMDTLETQTKFAESLNSPFPLMADAEGTAARAYGVMSEGKDGTKYASRVTFVISKDGKITSVFEGKDAIDPAGALGACH